MSLIQPNFVPRKAFNMDMWHQPTLPLGPSTLDVFDPWDNADRTMARNFQWLNKPFENMWQQQPIENKYRINVDCTGYTPESIKIDVTDDKRKLEPTKKVVVTGSVGPAEELNEAWDEREEDYTGRRFRRTFKLPKNVDWEHWASFMTSDHQLVIEFPLKNDEGIKREGKEMWEPQIVEDEKDHHKSVWMNMHIPKGMDPSKIKVTCKDHDVIVHGEEWTERPDSFAQTSFYKRCTLPDNTDFDHLRCFYDNSNKLKIEAPIDETKAEAIEQPMDTKPAIEN